MRVALLGLLGGGVLLGGAALLFDQFRTRHVMANETVTWQCTADSRLHGGPIVVLRYERAPEYFSYREDPDGSFCKLLTVDGYPSLTAVADVFGEKHTGFRGWTDQSLDGIPFPLGLNGGDGQEGQPVRPSPYQEDFEAARHRGFNWLR